MTLRVPPSERSVRPPDLDPATREAMRADDARERAVGKTFFEAFELPILIASALVLTFLIKTFLLQAFFIPTGSMIPTLLVDDRVLVEKVSLHFRDFERGEVIVFRRPGMEGVGADTPAGVARSFFEGLGLARPPDDLDLIKRIIGLPGETVEIRDGTVFVDAVALTEPYTQPETRDYGPERVPDGHLLMLGDNRMNSDDSRFSLGPVPVSNVVGRAFVIVWPPSSFNVGLDTDYGEVGERPRP